MLTSDDRAVLLTAAREAVRSAVLRTAAAPLADDRAAFAASRGAFVTLRENGVLRGCIGYVDAAHPLLMTVERAARLAATEDRRFRPVREAELPFLEIEISVLSLPEEIRGPEEIVIGTHGVLLEAPGHRGLLLPQVAPEQGWDARTLLEQTAAKAGLPRDAWRESGVRLFRFTAEVFQTHAPHHAF